VGEVDGDDVYIWTHKKFDIGYNDKHIVDVNLTSEYKVKLEPKIKISFTYEVIFLICDEEVSSLTSPDGKVELWKLLVFCFLLLLQV
jgi:hypothetical protein